MIELRLALFCNQNNRFNYFLLHFRNPRIFFKMFMYLLRLQRIIISNPCFIVYLSHLSIIFHPSIHPSSFILPSIHHLSSFHPSIIFHPSIHSSVIFRPSLYLSIIFHPFRLSLLFHLSHQSIAIHPSTVYSVRLSKLTIVFYPSLNFFFSFFFQYHQRFSMCVFESWWK